MSLDRKGIEQTLLIKLRPDIDHPHPFYSVLGNPNSSHQYPALHRFHPSRLLLQTALSHTNPDHHFNSTLGSIIILRARKQQCHLVHRFIKCLQRYIRFQRRRCRYPNLSQQLGRPSMVEHYCHQITRRNNFTTGRKREEWEKEKQRLGEAGI